MEHPKSARHELRVPSRPTAALTVLLHDVSTSMEGSKHRAACEAAVKEMAEADSHFILGAFNHDVFFPSRVPMNSVTASKAIKQIPPPSGGTALYRAVKEGAELMEQILDAHPLQYDPRLAVVKVSSIASPNLHACFQSIVYDRSSPTVRTQSMTGANASPEKQSPGSTRAAA